MSANPIRSRVQFVIVLAVIGLVAALVIPAIQKVREIAVLVQCSNNLKQINLGLQNYESANGRTPKLTDYGKDALTGNGITSPFFEFMPYMEAFPFVYAPGSNPERYHGPRSKVIDYKDKFGQPSSRHGGVVNTVWLVLLDPTASRELCDIQMTLPDGSTGYYATGSYAANGMLPWGSGTVKQLGANTIVFAERPQVCRTSAGETIYNLWGVGFYSPHMPAFAALAPLESPESWTTCQVSPAWPLPAEADAEQIRIRIGREDAVPQPQDFQYPIQRIINGEPCDPRLPGSMHSNGMNCLMSDGSVKMFSYRTSQWVFWNVCVPPSGE